MGKKRPSPPGAKSPAGSQAGALTPDRIVRLYHLVRLLGKGAQTRAVIQRRLKFDVRGFYRDLESLRTAGVDVALNDGRYSLSQAVDVAFSLLPFPDPQITCGQAQVLSKGRTATHRKLKEQIAGLTG